MRSDEDLINARRRVLELQGKFFVSDVLELMAEARADERDSFTNCKEVKKNNVR